MTVHVDVDRLEDRCERAPDDRGLHLTLIAALLEQGQPVRALAHCQLRLILEPVCGPAAMLAVDACLQTGDPRAADYLRLTQALTKADK